MMFDVTLKMSVGGKIMVKPLAATSVEAATKLANQLVGLEGVVLNVVEKKN